MIAIIVILAFKYCYWMLLYAITPSIKQMYEYKDMYASMKKPAFIFDGRKFLDHDSLIKIGFQTETIGKRYARNALVRGAGGDSSI